MTDRGAQLRVLAEDYLAVIVLALVVVGLLGGYVTYGAYATTDTRTETQTVSTWQSTGEFTHRATVVNGTDAFAEGEVLSDRSVYFRDDTPRLNGSFTYGYTADDGNLAANVSLVLVQRSIDESGDGNDTVLWQVERPRENITRSLAPGESANVSFSMNVSAVSERATTIDEQLGAEHRGRSKQRSRRVSTSRGPATASKSTERGCTRSRYRQRRAFTGCRTPDRSRTRANRRHGPRSRFHPGRSGAPAVRSFSSSRSPDSSDSRSVK